MMVFVSLSTCLMFLPSLPITIPVLSPGIKKTRPWKGWSEEPSAEVEASGWPTAEATNIFCSEWV